MSQFDFDLFVIGGGSGGVRAARWSAGLGAKVALCEYDRLGGTCVVRGCIPKKFMVLSSHLPEEIEAMKNYGWSAQIKSFDWNKFKTVRDNEIKRLSGLYAGMLDKNNVSFFNDKGRIRDAHTVEVGGKTYTAERILIATGGKPNSIGTPGEEHTWSSNDMFTTESQPEKIFIYGGGFIGVEFAGIMHGLGSEVHLGFRSDTILKGFDNDCRKFLQQELLRKKINIHPNQEVRKIVKIGQKLHVATTDQNLEVDAVLYAVGRIPNTSELGLEKLKISMRENGAIEVNDQYQTSINSIYALGDCTDRINLTPVATAEGTALAEHWFNNRELNLSYENIPSAVFSGPPLATVGMTEAAARERFDKVDIYKSDFRALKHTISGLEERTFMKIIVDTFSQKVVGVHMVGADAPEIMQGIAVALKAGATKDDFDQTIGIHPTSAEEFVTMRTKA